MEGRVLLWRSWVSFLSYLPPNSVCSVDEAIILLIVANMNAGVPLTGAEPIEDTSVCIVDCRKMYLFRRCDHEEAK